MKSTSTKSRSIKVLFVSAEVAPFAKVGGLADVAGALPQTLKNLGVDIRIIMPLHRSTKKILTEKKYKTKKIIRNFPVEYGGKIEKIDVFEVKLNPPLSSFAKGGNIENVPVYFIDHKIFTSAEKIYENENKFLFFSKAVVDIMGHFRVNSCSVSRSFACTDIIHCNDNHTALIPVMIKIKKLPIKTVFTIHNLMHQGKISCEDLKFLGITEESASSLKKDSENGDINKMAQGILHADIINTVSPTYAKEILTQEYGEGLEKILQMRKRNLYGIINGIDTEKLNPENDPLIPCNYSIKNLKGKERCKEELLKKYWKIIPFPFILSKNRHSEAESQRIPLSSSLNHGILQAHSALRMTQNQRDNVEPPSFPAAPPLIGLVSRLDSQKGIDLVISALPELFKNHPEVRFILLGTGISEYENQLKILAEKYPENFKALIKFDIKTAQEIYAGSDIFLMPSKFEPCGLGQLTAMRYGTVPIVRKTGGLADTVQNSKLKTQNSKLQNDANGFVFKKYSVNALLKAIEQALNVYQNKKMWEQITLNGMRRNSSWKNSAKKYLELYMQLKTQNSKLKTTTKMSKLF